MSIFVRANPESWMTAYCNYYENNFAFVRSCQKEVVALQIRKNGFTFLLQSEWKKYKPWKISGEFTDELVSTFKT